MILLNKIGLLCFILGCFMILKAELTQDAMSIEGIVLAILGAVIYLVGEKVVGRLPYS